MSRGFGAAQVFALRFLLADEDFTGRQSLPMPVPLVTRARFSGRSPEWAAEFVYDRRYDWPDGTAPGESMRRALNRLAEQGLVEVHRSESIGWNLVRLTDAGRLAARRLSPPP